jgi:hypothetical protein
MSGLGTFKEMFDIEIWFEFFERREAFVQFFRLGRIYPNFEC